MFNQSIDLTTLTLPMLCALATIIGTILFVSIGVSYLVTSDSKESK